ncbi:hypothetical protein [Roseiflexus sp.]|uniref:hypothetical protein n=1 Tax=Roseiflexus sp. TaxID=2562120 RepID=UPI00398BBB10
MHHQPHTMTISRRIAQSVALLCSIPLLLIQFRLYLPPADVAGPGRIPPDVVAQLRFLRGALDRGAGEEMQLLFPEGFFFTHVLYGLAWVDVGATVAADDPLRAQAITAAWWAADRLDAPAALAPFSSTLDPPFGVFVVGWGTWLRTGALALEAPDQRAAEQVARVIADCEALSAAFSRSATPFLTSYPNQAWPVDSVVGIAALSRCNDLFEARYGDVIARWIAMAQERTDPTTGLLSHRADPQSGQPIDSARGSSQSIIVRFLPAVDAEWGLEQYRRFREQFVTTVAGLPGVREYPHGQEGVGDVDSGPLLAGVSFSATTVTLGAARAWGDTRLAEPLRLGGEFLGMGIDIGGEKPYALGVLPVGDAFLAWSKTAPLWQAAQPAPTFDDIAPWWWRLPLHAASLALIALIWLPFRRSSRISV